MVIGKVPRGRALGLSLAAVFFLGCFAARAGDDPSLPDGIGYVVSVDSGMDFLAALDAFVAASLDGTPQEYDPGVLPFMAMMLLPLPMTGIDFNFELHAVVPEGVDIGEDTPAFIAAIGSFDDFRQSFFEQENSATPDGIHYFTSDQEIDYYVADLKNGFIVIAGREDFVRIVLNAVNAGWWPKTADDAKLTLTFNSLAGFAAGGLLHDAVQEVLRGYSETFEQCVEAAESQGYNAHLLAEIAPVLIDRAANALVDEISLIRGGRIDCRVDEGMFGISLTVAPSPSSFLGRAVASASGNGEDGLSPFRDAVDKSRVAYMQANQSSDILPGSGLAGSSVAAFSEALPANLAADLTDAWERYLAAGPGEMAQSTFAPGKNAVYVKTRNAAAAVHALLDLYRAAGNILFTLFGWEDGGKAVYVIEDESFQGVRYHRARLNPAAAANLFGLAPSGKSVDVVSGVVSGLDILVGAAGDVVVLVAGGADPEDYLDAVTALGNPAADPLLEQPAAVRLLDLLGNRRFGLGLAKVNYLCRLFLESVIAEYDLSNGGMRALRQAMEDFADRGEFVAVSHGAEDGNYTLEAVVGSAGVNEMMANYYLVVERESAYYGESDAEDAAENSE